MSGGSKNLNCNDTQESGGCAAAGAAFPSRSKLALAMFVLAGLVGPFSARCDASTAAPVFSPAAGAYHSAQTVTIRDSTPGATIYYTLDGSRPNTGSHRYTGPIYVSTSMGFHALAIAGGSTSADVVSWYTMDLPAAVPTVSPAPGTYNQIQNVTLRDSTPNATIYYTLDGSYPNESSKRYTGPFPATTQTNVTAVAYAPSYETGSALRASYTIVAPPPVITPASGTFQGSATVTMSDAVAGAQIHYTSNGPIPTASSPVYYSPIVKSQYQTVTAVYQAMATAPGYLPSATTMATFIVAQPAGALASATVGMSATRTIPGDFLGISLDWQTPIALLGQPSSAVNIPFQTLIKNLQVNNGTPMVFRIAADNTDVSDLQGIMEPLTEFARDVNVNYVLGVDMWRNSASLAGAEAKAWKEGIPNSAILGFELGNEVDNYQYNGGRSRSYTYSDYLSQFQQWQKSIDENTGGLGVVGPEMGQESNWIADTISSLESGTMSPVIVSQHAYGGAPTTDPIHSTGGAPWPADALLEPELATQMPEKFAALAGAAHKTGRSFRMSEVNSFWGGGIEGISNTFQSSLWSIDLMFNYLKNGMDGVNWNTDDAAYTLLYYTVPKNSSGVGHYILTQVNPLYYGLLVFSQMANNGGKLLPVTTSTSANTSIWATIDNSSTVHVAVVNKDKNATGKVTIDVPGYTKGTVRYLSGAGYWATNGVTLGGQTFDASEDGKIRGQLVTSTITSSTGHFALANMPIECAAVIDFTK